MSFAHSNKTSAKGGIKFRFSQTGPWFDVAIPLPKNGDSLFFKAIALGHGQTFSIQISEHRPHQRRHVKQFKLFDQLLQKSSSALTSADHYRVLWQTSRRGISNSFMKMCYWMVPEKNTDEQKTVLACRSLRRIQTHKSSHFAALQGRPMILRMKNSASGMSPK